MAFPSAPRAGLPQRCAQERRACAIAGAWDVGDVGDVEIVGDVGDVEIVGDVGDVGGDGSAGGVGAF
ncbi:MAG: hypothetical protein M0Z63_13715 [Actinomycetota bacterium]|nr:hypothetical protein [Actinomycetota bacterium]